MGKSQNSQVQHVGSYAISKITGCVLNLNAKSLKDIENNDLFLQRVKNLQLHVHIMLQDCIMMTI